MRLTERMKAFAQHWVKTGGKNATESAIATSPAGRSRDAAGSMAARWLRMPQVQEYIRTLGQRAQELLAARTNPGGEETATLAVVDATLAEHADLTTRALDLAGVISGLSEEAQVDMADYFSLVPALEYVFGEDGKIVKDELKRPVTRPRLDEQGNPVMRAEFDLERAIREGKAKYIQEIKPTQWGWAVRLTDRQAAKVALSKIYQAMEEARRKGDDQEATLRAWSDVVAALKARPPQQLRELYLDHLSGPSIDVKATVVSTGNGNGNGKRGHA